MVHDGPRCIACAGAPEPLRPYEVRDAEDGGIFGGRTIARCPACGLQQITPVPSNPDLTTYYGGAYRAHGRWSGVDAERYPYDSPWYLSRGRALRRFLTASSWTERPGAGVSILDIGAGFGHVLFALSERVADAHLFATEPDPGCAPFLERIGARVLPQSSEGLPTVGERRFDLIVMTHVLEHLTRPLWALSGLAGLLERGGRVLIEVPNCPASFFGQWDMVPHLSFFEVDSLTSCITRAGGHVERMIVCGPRYEVRTWRDLVPASARRFVRRFVVPRRAAAPSQAPDWTDPDVIPDPTFTEVGPDRMWLRTLVSFD